METILEHCPFCGCDEVLLKTEPYRFGFVMSYAECQHCAARGGCFVEENTDESVEKVVDDWNQKNLRSVTISDKIKRIITQFRYDLSLIWYKIQHRDW
jgi:hypothetical protein